ncbi:MAG: helix-turn-helix domain-containing protein [Clostridia bacterium]|nr:helix-turn-helix domain-containing protein [Clostridia bacterium]
MFYKEKFANILIQIKETYPSQEEFSKYSGVGRTYISQYMNSKIDKPPKPKILEKIANSSKGITSYDELMKICGYVDEELIQIKQSLLNTDDEFLTVPIFINNGGKLEITKDDVVLPFKWDHIHQYFGYRATDDSMLPLLGDGDLAIVEKTNTYIDSRTYLISINNKDIIIRKIVDYKSYIELHNAFSYGKPMKLTKEDMKLKKFTILGEVIKAQINFR